MKSELYIEWSGGEKADFDPIEDNSDMIIRVQKLRIFIPIKGSEGHTVFRPHKIFASRKVIDILKKQSVRDLNVLSFDGDGMFFHRSPVFCIEDKNDKI